jgi:predicted DNA-binding transcriptional regulator AlpA
MAQASRTQANISSLQQPSGVCLLSKKQVCDKVSLSPHYVWRLIRAGKFPEGRAFGRRTLWVSSEIDAWIFAQPRRSYRRPAEVA